MVGPWAHRARDASGGHSGRALDQSASRTCVQDGIRPASTDVKPGLARDGRCKLVAEGRNPPVLVDV
jgi:hypothetical protein